MIANVSASRPALCNALLAAAMMLWGVAGLATASHAAAEVPATQPASGPAVDASASSMVIRHEVGRSIELVDEARRLVLWRYVYHGKPKPYFHPIHTLAGHCVTLLEPRDHFWHRGLWFTIKFVNGENFWEEGGQFGTQRTVLPPTVTHSPDGRIHVLSQLDWVRPDGRSVVLREQRQITHVPLSADAYAIDFQTTLTAPAEVTLDRRPFNRWGGYGGLIIRGSDAWREPRLLFPDGTVSQRPTPIPGRWCDLAATLAEPASSGVGVAIFDHPENPRHPTPWYGAAGAINYLNAAFLWHEPLRLAAGQSLTLGYRVLVHDGLWDAARLQAAYEAYLGACVRSP